MDSGRKNYRLETSSNGTIPVQTINLEKKMVLTIYKTICVHFDGIPGGKRWIWGIGALFVYVVNEGYLVFQFVHLLDKR